MWRFTFQFNNFSMKTDTLSKKVVSERVDFQGKQKIQRKPKLYDYSGQSALSNRFLSHKINMEKLENFWHNLFKKKDKKSVDKTDRVIKDDLKSDNNVISDGENKENVVSYDNKQKENLINTGITYLQYFM